MISSKQMELLIVLYWCWTMFLLVLGKTSRNIVADADPPFDTNYEVSWGFDHVLSLDGGRQIQLSLDNSSGSGFVSKSSYGSGLFAMRMKLHDKDSAGVVSGFYLFSKGLYHNELDLEFLGNKEGKPYLLQTNIYLDGVGGREQRFRLWFDPAADFHNYKILWNQYQIVFYVEDVPIRVFKNHMDKGIGYPTQPMHIDGTIWDADDWATDGGRTKTNWSHAPFKIHFRGFNIDGCPTDPGDYNIQHCYAPKYYWNANTYRDLSVKGQIRYQEFRKRYTYYNYCDDRVRYPIPRPECRF